MKKYTLLLFTCLMCMTAFAQISPEDVVANLISGEVLTLDSAPTMSGEIEIDLPFDPLEVEDVPDNTYFPPYTLNSASTIETGPGAILICLLAALL